MTNGATFGSGRLGPTSMGNIETAFVVAGTMGSFYTALTAANCRLDAQEPRVLFGRISLTMSL